MKEIIQERMIDFGYKPKFREQNDYYVVLCLAVKWLMEEKQILILIKRKYNYLYSEVSHSEDKFKKFQCGRQAKTPKTYMELLEAAVVGSIKQLMKLENKI